MDRTWVPGRVAGGHRGHGFAGYPDRLIQIRRGSGLRKPSVQRSAHVGERPGPGGLIVWQGFGDLRPQVPRSRDLFGVGRVHCLPQQPLSVRDHIGDQVR